MKRAPCTVDIEELVLVGFERSAGAELADALREALTRALITEGLPPGWRGSETSVNFRCDSLRLEASRGGGNSPAAVADSLVQALYTVGASGEQP